MFNHHEAKYTAAKLIFGELFQDQPLFEEGRRCLRQTLDRLHKDGMPEYGALPWFWHWVQAFTAALGCVTDEQVQVDLRSMLDYLWSERASVYLQGAWAGGRMRSLPQDLPADSSIAFDFVQFGDITLPDQLPRVEYAGLLLYDAGERVRDQALLRNEPYELKKRIVPVDHKQGIQQLHSYLYMTEQYAAGGVWERSLEFDNEQHRWEITFPLEMQHGGVNRLYALQPGDKYKEGDPRHESENGDTLFHQNVIIAHYPELSEGDNRLIGILPVGKWESGRLGLYGYVNNVYVSIYLTQPYVLNAEDDRVVLNIASGPSSVIVEAIAEEELKSIVPSVHHLNAFSSYMDDSKAAGFTMKDESITISYRSLRGDELTINRNQEGKLTRAINGAPVEFDDYKA